MLALPSVARMAPPFMHDHDAIDSTSGPGETESSRAATPALLKARGGSTPAHKNGNTISPAKVDSAEASTLDSNSEEEADLGPKTPKESEKRRTQAIKFSAYLSKRAVDITKKEIQLVDEHVKDENLSIRAMMSRQESMKIIDDPREYQMELFEKAKKENIIAVLDTGSGKTLIAVLLLKYMIDQELEDRACGKKPRISFFLVNCVTLVFQQFAVLECNLDQKVERFCGEMGCEMWSKDTWSDIFKENKVIVCTAEILYQCLMRAFISMADINLLIFDEAHHTKKNHAYARIIKDCYISQETAKRPIIFSMTASPVDAREDPVDAAKELETLLHSQIVTASDLSLLRNSISRPTEQVARYAPLQNAYETPLCAKLRKEFGNVTGFPKLFVHAREATRQLGEWCADQLWRFALADEDAHKLETKTERAFHADKENRQMTILDAQLDRIRQAKNVIANWKFEAPTLEINSLSSKVIELHRRLGEEMPSNGKGKCIIFVKKRYTARLLGALLPKIEPSHLRVGLLIGTRYGDPGDIKFSFREQVLTLQRFRKGELNCLIATSIAEEGLDIPDCNLIIRFDLYDTLIQYIQSRGRARHPASKYLHMCELGNVAHQQSIQLVHQGEAKMRQFCEALPKDRLLQGNDCNLEGALARERGHRVFTDPGTGAKLTYPSSLVVLAHFVGCLPHHADATPQAMFHISIENRKFVCEVILPENSPLHSATGLPYSRKSTAKRSAAFEACFRLRNSGHLDSNLIPSYHKVLPKMRNAHLALHTNKSKAYDMRFKPSLWAKDRGSQPGRLFVTVLELETPELLGRPCQPLALLTRTHLPDLPPFPLYVQSGKTSNVISSSVPESFEINSSTLAEVNVFTLRIYGDIFNKKFEFNEPNMSYWFAPVFVDWRSRGGQDRSEQLIDWNVVKSVSAASDSGIPWTMATPHDQLVGRYLIDRWDGGRRFFSVGLEPDLEPLDPVPGDAAPHKYMANIIDYTVSLFAKSRAKATWRHDQPVIRAEKIMHRLNLLDDYTDQEKKVKTRAYLVPEPLIFSTLPVSVVSMSYLFSAIITRLESYLITLEACSSLGLTVKPGLALEAYTKDSDNTEEHRAEQVQVQRGMGKNYERLEFIGDCFLKMATSISLFSQSPEDNEFQLHVDRMVMICNKNLLDTALKKKLYEYIRSMSFSRRNWYPQGVKLLEGKGHKKAEAEMLKHYLGDKTIADVCEATIGAALLSYRDTGDMDMAVKAVTVLVQSKNHNMSSWAEYYPLYEKPKYQLAQVSASQLDLAVQVEKVHDYHFKYPRLLRSAFIHPSYHFAAEKIPCYQRLEFLGDALLDMASISFLFHCHPDKDPQWLTEHKMAMVSNKFLAALSVKLGFHRHLRSNGAAIEYQNREYAIEVQDAERQAKGARGYWTNTKQPPKALSDIVESYVGAIFVDSEYNYKEVERFFDQQIREFFVDMSIYDTFANNHPTTYLHNLLSLSFGCHNYRLMASEVEAIAIGSPSTSIAVVMIHDEIVAEGQASSTKNAKVKASSNALKLLQNMAPLEYRVKYNCDCGGAEKDWVGKAGDGMGMVGSAI